MRKTIVGALRGRVLGVGLWLALECDIRIASNDVVLGLPEPIIGIPTIFAGFLNRHMPQAIASELLLTWENIGAQRAYEVGIINRVVPVDQLLWEATNIAVALSNNWALDWGEDLPVSPRPILWRIVVKEDKMRSQFDFQTGDVSRNISETCSSLKPLIYYFLV